MPTSRFSLVVSLFLSLCLAACSTSQDPPGGSETATPTPAPAANTSQLSVTLSDAPPAGVSVLSFEVDITGAALLPVVGSPVSLLPGNDPVNIEVTKLETESAVLSTIGAPAGTYNALQITLANPSLTVFNGSPNAIGACQPNSTCHFQPAASGSINYPSAPFPLTLVAGTPAALQIDVLLNQIIAGDLSVMLNSPSDIAVKELPVVPASGETGNVDNNEFAGMVASIDFTNHNFVVRNSMSGLSETIGTDANTKYEDFDEHGCASRNFSCLAASQIVEVETILKSDGSILAGEVKLEEQTDAQSIEGTLVSLSGNPPSQFQVVVLDEEPNLAGVHPGDFLSVSLSGTAKFDVLADGLAVPPGGSFAGPTDLISGQDLQIEPGAITAGSPISTSTSHVSLHTTQFTGTVSSVSGSTIAVTGLPAVFGLNMLTVLTSPQTEFEDALGASSLSRGDTISIRGLLFKTATGPVVVAAKIRKRGVGDD